MTGCCVVVLGNPSWQGTLPQWLLLLILRCLYSFCFLLTSLLLWDWWFPMEVRRLSIWMISQWGVTVCTTTAKWITQKISGCVLPWSLPESIMINSGWNKWFIHIISIFLLAFIKQQLFDRTLLNTVRSHISDSFLPLFYLPHSLPT